MLKHENSLVWHREVLGWINNFSGFAAETAEKREADFDELLEELIEWSVEEKAISNGEGYDHGQGVDLE